MVIAEITTRERNQAVCQELDGTDLRVQGCVQRLTQGALVVIYEPLTATKTNTALPCWKVHQLSRVTTRQSWLNHRTGGNAGHALYKHTNKPDKHDE